MCVNQHVLHILSPLGYHGPTIHYIINIYIFTCVCVCVCMCVCLHMYVCVLLNIKVG